MEEEENIDDLISSVKKKREDFWKRVKMGDTAFDVEAMLVEELSKAIDKVIIKKLRNLE